MYKLCRSPIILLVYKLCGIRRILQTLVFYFKYKSQLKTEDDTINLKIIKKCRFLLTDNFKIFGYINTGITLDTIYLLLILKN